MNQIGIFILLTGVLGWGQEPAALRPVAVGVPASQAAIEEAIRIVEHSQVDGLAGEALQQKKAEVEQARGTLSAAGGAGMDRIERELRALKASGAKADPFKLTAAALLWKIGGISKAGAVARIWESTPLDARYEDVFSTAAEAARTRDPRVLPMLKACLKDGKGRYVREDQGLNLAAPMTHQVLWGIYGAAGLPELLKLLDHPSTEQEMQSALLILADAQYLPALPKMRDLARSEKKNVRMTAIGCLGLFGHPADFEFLVSGLGHGDPEIQWSFVWALNEYGDLRAVPYLIPLLQTRDDPLRLEVEAALGSLLTPTSVETLRVHCEEPPTRKDVRFCELFTAGFLRIFKSDWIAYDSLSAPEREQILAALRRESADGYRLKPGDRALSREDFLRALEAWAKARRVSEGPWDWVKVKHMLAAGVPQDLGLLFDVRGAVLGRLGPESQSEAVALGDTIKWLGRGRYRTVPWLTERSEKPAAK